MDIFEKTMRACLESKKDNKKNSKKITESKKLKEDDFQDEFNDAEIDVVTDEDPIMPGIDTDIVVVVDPEGKDDGDYIDPAIDAQKIVDNTPEGDVPYTDEFIGDFTYTCPICGNTFFSEEEMHDGDECPVCGDTPNGYVLVGQVDTAPAQEEDMKDDTSADTEDETDEEEVDIDEEIDDNGEDLDIDVDEIEDVTAEEKCDPKKKMRRESDKKICDDLDVSVKVADDDEDEEDIEVNYDMEESKKKCPCCGKDEKDCRCEKKMTKRESVRRNRTSVAFKIDESTFNPFMTKFIRENYKNARSFTMKSAKIAGKVLTVECVVTFNSGKQKNVTLKSANFNPKMESLVMRDNGMFKCESKSNAPFSFKVKMEGRVLRCDGMKYNFVTRVAEGKRVQISGNLARKAKMESKRNFQNKKVTRSCSNNKRVNEKRTINSGEYGKVEFDGDTCRKIFNDIKRLLKSEGYEITDQYYINPEKYFRDASKSYNNLEPNAQIIFEHNRNEPYYDDVVSLYGYRFIDGDDDTLSKTFGVDIQGFNKNLSSKIKNIVNKYPGWTTYSE